MSTEAIAERNRQNAQKSTGPKTTEGKAAVKLNAFRHELTGQTIVLHANDVEAYDTFCAGIHANLAPEGELELSLVPTIADTHGNSTAREPSSRLS